MRLPGEIRNLVYTYLWNATDCTVAADHMFDTSAWSQECGPPAAFGPVQVPKVLLWGVAHNLRDVAFFPKILLKMDPRIQNEFVGELLRAFPMRLYASERLLADGHFKITKMPPRLYLDNMRSLKTESTLCSLPPVRIGMFRGSTSPCLHLNAAHEENVKKSIRELGTALHGCRRLSKIQIQLNLCLLAVTRARRTRGDEHHYFVTDFVHRLRHEIASCFVTGPPAAAEPREVSIIENVNENDERAMMTTYTWSTLLQCYVPTSLHGSRLADQKHVVRKNTRKGPHNEATCQEKCCVLKRARDERDRLDHLRYLELHRPDNALKRTRPTEPPIQPQDIYLWIRTNVWPLYSISVTPSTSFPSSQISFGGNPFLPPTSASRFTRHVFPKDFPKDYRKRAARTSALRKRIGVATDSETQHMASTAIIAFIQSPAIGRDESANTSESKRLDGTPKSSLTKLWNQLEHALHFFFFFLFAIDGALTFLSRNLSANVVSSRTKSAVKTTTDICRLLFFAALSALIMPGGLLPLGVVLLRDLQLPAVHFTCNSGSRLSECVDDGRALTGLRFTVEDTPALLWNLFRLGAFGAGFVWLSLLNVVFISRAYRDTHLGSLAGAVLACFTAVDDSTVANGMVDDATLDGG